MTTYKPPAPPFIGARHRGGSQKPRAIVMHGTVSSDNPGTARNIAGWWAGPTSPVTSAHYIVDPREVIQAVGDHTVAYHCGYNTGSIGVELCDEQAGPASRWSDADSQAIIKRAARLTAELCLAYGIEPVRPTIAELKAKGPHGIYGHDDSRLAFGHTTHTDPREFPWSQFLKLVKVEIAAIKKGDKIPTPKPPARQIYWKGERLELVKWVIQGYAKNGNPAQVEALEEILKIIESVPWVAQPKGKGTILKAAAAAAKKAVGLK